MPAAIVGLALVGGGVVTSATLGYIGLGLSVAGMVTKNKTLLKIGGQLGLAAGVAGLATSFMGSGASALGAAGDAGKVALGATNTGDAAVAPTPEVQDLNTAPDASQSKALNSYQQRMVDMSDDSAARNALYEAEAKGWQNNNTTTITPTTPVAGNTGTGLLGGNAGTGLGEVGGTQGKNVVDGSSNLGNVNVSTPADDAGMTEGQMWEGSAENMNQNKNKGFYDYLTGMSNGNKYAMVEGGKIIAGGIKGLADTSAANTQLDERRRIADLQRANAAQAGRLNYGLMSRPA